MITHAGQDRLFEIFNGNTHTLDIIVIFFNIIVDKAIFVHTLMLQLGARKIEGINNKKGMDYDKYQHSCASNPLAKV